MAQRQGELGIERMCALAGVSRASFYRSWRACAPREEETALRDAVQRIALAHRRYGHRRIAAELRRSGLLANKKRVLRIMREDNLLCVPKRAFAPPTTDSRHGFPVYPNLARHLKPMAANQLWVADITYVRLREEFVYLAVVLDAFSRRVIGWNLATHLQAALALGESRLPAAFEVLREAWERGGAGEQRRTLLVAIAMLRIDEALEFLLGRLAEESGPVAADALAGLAFYARDEAVLARVQGIIQERGDGALEAVFEREFSRA